MKEIILQVPDNQYSFFLELIKKLKFAKITESKAKVFTPKQQEFIADLKQSLQDVDLHLQGKVKLQDAREFLDEL